MACRRCAGTEAAPWRPDRLHHSQQTGCTTPEPAHHPTVAPPHPVACDPPLTHRGEDLDRLAVPAHKAACLQLAARAEHISGGVAAQGDDGQRLGAPGNAAAGVGRQLARQAGPAADGVGQGDVAAARHPLALALKGADEPALLGGGGGEGRDMGRGGQAQAGGWWGNRRQMRHSESRTACLPVAGAPPCRNRGRWADRWRARTRTASAGWARLWAHL